MIESLKKTVYATIGATLMARAKAGSIGKKILSEIRASETDGKLFVDGLVKQADDAKCAVETLIGKQVDFVLDKMNVVTRKELDGIEKRLEAVEQQGTSDRMPG